MKSFPRHGFAILVAVLLLARFSWQVSFLFKPVDTLLGLVADDLFYYLAISKNMFLGHGVSADGISPTNGFHPLFMAMVYPFNWILDLDLRVKAVLASLLILDALAIFVFYRTLSTRIDAVVACVATLALALSKDYAQISLHGLEVSLATFMLSITVAFAWRLSDRNVIQWGEMFGLGVLCGACVLARTDLGLVAIAIPAALLFEKTKGRRMVWLLGFGFSLLPWCAWNVRTFGTLLQSSARTHAYREWFLVHSEVAAKQGSMLMRQLQSWMGGVRYAVEAFGGSLFWVAMAVPLWTFVRILQRRSWDQPSVRVMLVCWFSGLAMIAGYTFFFHFQHWYLHSLLWFWMLAFALALQDWTRGFRKRWIVGVVCLFVLVGNRKTGSLYYPMMKMNPAVREAIVREIPARSKIGMFSSGYYQYYLSSYEIVNLDGAVNNAIYPAIRSKTLYDWIGHRGLQYVVDYEVACRQWFELFGPGSLDGHFSRMGTLKSPTGMWNVAFLQPLPSEAKP